MKPLKHESANVRRHHYTHSENICELMVQLEFACAPSYLRKDNSIQLNCPCVAIGFVLCLPLWFPIRLALLLRGLCWELVHRHDQPIEGGATLDHGSG